MTGRVLYAPKGKAREYAELAANLWTGCCHRSRGVGPCRYCYNVRSMRRTVEQFRVVRPRLLDRDLERREPPGTAVVEKFQSELFRVVSRSFCQLCGGEGASPSEAIERVSPSSTCRLCGGWGWDRLSLPRVHLSFSCDPYPPEEREFCVTEHALRALGQWGMRFDLLTKSVDLPLRDWRLHEARPSPNADAVRVGRLGVTIPCVNVEWSAQWEPGAPEPMDRVKLLWLARARGLETFVSVEPAPTPAAATEVVRALLIDGTVSEIRVGRPNHCPELEAGWRDGPETRRQCLVLAQVLRDGGVPYLVKSGSRESMPEWFDPDTRRKQ
jgi:hypothetical protein